MNAMRNRAAQATGLIVLGLLIALCAGNGCAFCHCYGKMHGALLDAQDGKPITNAAVVGVYHVELGTVGGIVDRPVNANETQPDAQGRFVLPGKFIFSPHLPLSHFAKQPWIYIYAPGYESLEMSRDQAYSMIDPRKIPLSTNVYGDIIYQLQERHIITVVATNHTTLYEYRLTPVTTAEERRRQAGVAGPRGSPSKFPHYLKLLNADREKYGLPEWKGWDK